MNNEQMEGGRL
jgi:hypothetical protein